MTVSDDLAAWLRRSGIEVGHRRLPGPEWLAVADLHPLRTAARALERAGDEVDEVRVGLRRTLEEAAESLGWSGEAATAAGGRAARTSRHLGELVDLLHELSHELFRHAASVEDTRERLRALVTDAEYHVAGLDGEFLDNPLTVLRENGSGHGDLPDRLTALHRCAARMREVLLEAGTEDHARAAHVVDLGSTILEVAASLDSDSWVDGVVPPAAREVLRSVGVVQTATERSLAAWAADLPFDAEGARVLRDRLDGLTTDEVAQTLERHPRLAALLACGRPASPPSADGLDADSRRRLALLHPTVVGNLDGIPLEDRVAANRVAVAAALFVRQGGDDPRTAFYERLLYERVPDPQAAPGDPATVAHQVLAFDEASGRLAEMWGRVEPGRTREVALVSPDSPSDFARFAEVSDAARAAATRDPGLVVVAWTGGDPPDLGPSLPPGVEVRPFEGLA